MDLPQMIQEVSALAREEQNRCLQVAMRDMELASYANNQDQKAALENNINLCLLLSDNFHSALRSPCAQNDKINVLHEPYFGTHILGNHLPFQTSEIPKKNTKPLISIRGLAFDKLLQSSEK